jgi:predicted glycoside hydrolase/deacetylase ChbG (UPF0249 family)
LLSVGCKKNRLALWRSILCQYNMVASKGIVITHLDTHCHVHCIPYIAEALVSIAQRHAVSSIRCLTMQKRYFAPYLFLLFRCGFAGQIPKIAFLYGIFGYIKKRFDRSGIIYSKNTIIMPTAIRGDSKRFLGEVRRLFRDVDAEFITHPGDMKEYSEKRDPYWEQRQTELEMLEACLPNR